VIAIRVLKQRRVLPARWWQGCGRGAARTDVSRCLSATPRDGDNSCTLRQALVDVVIGDSRSSTELHQ
jgi:transposase